MKTTNIFQSQNAVTETQKDKSDRFYAMPFGTREKSRAHAYLHNDEGTFTIFGMFTFVILILLAGIGVDVMRQEQLRTELQSTLDRAILAAANVNSSLDPEDVVRDYFAKAGLADFIESIDTPETENGTSITVSVQAEIPTYFMKFAGLDTLTVGTYGTAEQGRSNLEVAMVLDVSGSMASSSRLTNMSAAGQEFADIIFENSDEDLISVSVIPYSTQVNVGPTILDALDVDRVHSYSNCLNFDSADFDDAALAFPSVSQSNASFDQTMHFDPRYNPGANNGLYWTVCDPDSNTTVLPFSNSLTEIKNKIDGLVAGGNTSIDIGVKWGAAFLSEDNTKLTEALNAAGEIDSTMLVYPQEETSTALKVMVVMTDGQNTGQYYMVDPYREGYSDMYISTSGKTSMPAIEEECTTETYSYYSYSQHKWKTGTTTTCEDVDGYFYDPETGNTTNKPAGASSSWSEPDEGDVDIDMSDDSVRQMSWAEVWAAYSVQAHAEARYYANNNDYSLYQTWRGLKYNYHSTTTKNVRMLQACTAAKNMGTIVFTIGFEAPSSVTTTLKNCASSDAHYYDVDGLEISEAFAAIATKVTELRLVE